MLGPSTYSCQSVGESVSESLIVSDWRLLSHLRALWACFFFYFLNVSLILFSTCSLITQPLLWVLGLNKLKCGSNNFYTFEPIYLPLNPPRIVTAQLPPKDAKHNGCSRSREFTTPESCLHIRTLLWSLFPRPNVIIHLTNALLANLQVIDPKSKKRSP